MKLPAPLYDALRVESTIYPLGVVTDIKVIEEVEQDKYIHNMIDPLATGRCFYKGVYIQKMPVAGIDVITGIASMRPVVFVRFQGIFH